MLRLSTVAAVASLCLLLTPLAFLAGINGVSPSPPPPAQPPPPPRPCPTPTAAPSSAAARQPAVMRRVVAPPSAQSARNVVIGLASGIPVQNLYQFVSSVRRACPDADVVVFIDEMTTVVDEMFRHFRISAVEYAIAQLPEVARAYHPSSYRWMLFHQFLSQLPAGRFTNVMFVDTRDTVFQRDPFSFLSGPGFYAFVEAGPKRIASCTWNRGWVADCFGDDVLRDVGTKPISCSGTSMASWEHAVLYARLMAAEIEGNACERNGVDQGMHNVLVHQGRIKDVHFVANEDGWIATVQNMRFLRRNMFGEVLNDNDEVVAVVHQYDRSPQLLSQYRDHFRLIDDADLMKK